MAEPAWLAPLRTMPRVRRTGRVSHVTEMGLESQGPQVALGEVCDIQLADGSSLQAEVVALREHSVVLMPYATSKGLSVGCEVRALDVQPTVRVSPSLIGRVVDAFANPLDVELRDLGTGSKEMPLHPTAINPLHRAPVTEPMITGVRVLDALLPLGKGQRLGIFAGSGVGKSSLLGMLARNLDTQLNVVALIGERGREVREFIEQRMSPQARARSIVVVATAEQPAVVRARAAYTALSIAEYFRAKGQHVLLLMDSVTRFAMARREIDLAAGQPATARGYTPSVFSAVPALCERCGGLDGAGSITALFTVLVEGDDHQEPIADTLRATLDGHIVLTRDLANAGHFPAIDVLQSVSRLDSALLSAEVMRNVHHIRRLLAVHHRQREMVDMGLYKAGSNPELDEALTRWEALQGFLRQSTQEHSTREQTVAHFAQLFSNMVPA